MAICFLKSGFSAICVTAERSFAEIAFGVPLGSRKPCQPL
jgi:hypothetical protein